MANDDIEIEIKVPLDKSTFSKVKAKLADTATFKGIKRQVDEYFTPAHKEYLDFDYPYEWLRIGQRGDKVMINYKHFYPENDTPFTHCDEFETDVGHMDHIQKIFKAIGAKSLVTVDKERSTYVYDDAFEIALDEVKELGAFIEIEALKDLGGVEKTREKLFELAKQLGIDTSRTAIRGYPYLLMEKKGMLKKK